MGPRVAEAPKISIIPHRNTLFEGEHGRSAALALSILFR
jgi:hypothetical protein